MTPAWSSSSSVPEVSCGRERLSASRLEISAEMMAKGAQRVRAQDIPTIPMSVVAAPMERTRRVENMQAEKMRWDSIHALLSVNHGITSLSRNRVVNVV